MLRSSRQISRDKRAILTFMDSRKAPVLFSDIELGCGDHMRAAHDELIRNGEIEATFPEAKPGDSGRQFWQRKGAQSLQTG